MIIHRLNVSRAEIGAVWSKRSNEGRDYLSLKLDDPTVNAPILANLFDDKLSRPSPHRSCARNRTAD